MARVIEVSAHFDAERIVVDEPFEFPVGAALRVRVIESEDDQKARLLQALHTQN